MATPEALELDELEELDEELVEEVDEEVVSVEPAPPPDEDELHAPSSTAQPSDATTIGNPRMS